jgi:hypothetical protein
MGPLFSRPPDLDFGQDDEDGDGHTTASSMHAGKFESDDADDNECSSESDCQYETDMDTDHDLYDSDDVDKEETPNDNVGFTVKLKFD